MADPIVNPAKSAGRRARVNVMLIAFTWLAEGEVAERVNRYAQRNLGRISVLYSIDSRTERNLWGDSTHLYRPSASSASCQIGTHSHLLHFVALRSEKNVQSLCHSVKYIISDVSCDSTVGIRFHKVRSGQGEQEHLPSPRFSVTNVVKLSRTHCSAEKNQ